MEMKLWTGAEPEYRHCREGGRFVKKKFFEGLLVKYALNFKLSKGFFVIQEGHGPFQKTPPKLVVEKSKEYKEIEWLHMEDLCSSTQWVPTWLQLNLGIIYIDEDDQRLVDENMQITLQFAEEHLEQTKLLQARALIRHVQGQKMHYKTIGTCLPSVCRSKGKMDIVGLHNQFFFFTFGLESSLAWPQYTVADKQLSVTNCWSIGRKRVYINKKIIEPIGEFIKLVLIT